MAQKLSREDMDFIEVKPSGSGPDIHVLVVARRVFENWRWSERDLFRFLRDKFGGTGDLGEAVEIFLITLPGFGSAVNSKDQPKNYLDFRHAFC
jgi:hypothetical protein